MLQRFHDRSTYGSRDGLLDFRVSLRRCIIKKKFFPNRELPKKIKLLFWCLMYIKTYLYSLANLEPISLAIMSEAVSQVLRTRLRGNLSGIEQKPNSWTFNFVEVSVHNLESSQTWGFRIQCFHYKPVPNHFFSRGGGSKMRWLWEARRKTLQNFVPITSKNSASDIF